MCSSFFNFFFCFLFCVFLCGQGLWPLLLAWRVGVCVARGVSLLSAARDCFLVCTRLRMCPSVLFYNFCLHRGAFYLRTRNYVILSVFYVRVLPSKEALVVKGVCAMTKSVRSPLSSVNNVCLLAWFSFDHSRAEIERYK